MGREMETDTEIDKYGTGNGNSETRRNMKRNGDTEGIDKVGKRD